MHPALAVWLEPKTEHVRTRKSDTIRITSLEDPQAADVVYEMQRLLLLHAEVNPTE
jgi:hypothetical protein